ncbi:chitinase 2-like [Canna indica]|uniref:Chitinase 2-like n=1 Tax=Canna indica TaxID=4628 RepID=A0AAQ3Q4S5_9LILI|nr:chitinase 2-like [Canna indica]
MEAYHLLAENRTSASSFQAFGTSTHEMEERQNGRRGGYKSQCPKCTHQHYIEDCHIHHSKFQVFFLVVVLHAADAGGFWFQNSTQNFRSATEVLCIKLLLLFLAAVHLFICQFSDGKVMMEYIGATGKPVTFSDVPVHRNIDCFHFILGFAVDADPSGASQNGIFSPYWTSTLTPSAVQAIKADLPSVKVLASLSGWSLGSKKILRWYNPADPMLWISNAVASLKSLVLEYHLDGIDVDYENYPRNDTTFAVCIGELITQLKEQGVISVATIAPFHNTVWHYAELFRRYADVIDYVNYQFYTDRVTQPKIYWEAFALRAAQFNATKLLPSYEVNGRGIQGDAFFDALRLLERKGFDVNGVMIYSADASSSNGYYYEKKSQEFLLNSTA